MFTECHILSRPLLVHLLFRAVVADTGTLHNTSQRRTSLLFMREQLRMVGFSPLRTQRHQVHFSASASGVLLFGLSLLCFEARVTRPRTTSPRHHANKRMPKNMLTKQVYKIGNCLNHLTELPKIDLICTDPPFNFSTHGHGIMRKRDYLDKIQEGFGSDFDPLIYLDLFYASCSYISSIIGTKQYNIH